MKIKEANVIEVTVRGRGTNLDEMIRESLCKKVSFRLKLGCQIGA